MIAGRRRARPRRDARARSSPIRRRGSALEAHPASADPSGCGARARRRGRGRRRYAMLVDPAAGRIGPRRGTASIASWWSTVRRRCRSRASCAQRPCTRRRSSAIMRAQATRAAAPRARRRRDRQRRRRGGARRAGAPLARRLCRLGGPEGRATAGDRHIAFTRRLADSRQAGCIIGGPTVQTI